MLAAGGALYWLVGESWWLFALLILTPDASMLGYLLGRGPGRRLTTPSTPTRSPRSWRASAC